MKILKGDLKNMEKENEILNKLSMIYNFEIIVKLQDIRYYIITCKIDNEKTINIPFIYDCYLTLDGNIDYLIKEIDERIPELFKR